MNTPTEDLARRHALEKIAVNSVGPAMTETPLLNLMTADVLAKAISAMPHGLAMQPDEVAARAAFLTSPARDIFADNGITLNQGRDVW